MKTSGKPVLGLPIFSRTRALGAAFGLACLLAVGPAFADEDATRALFEAASTNDMAKAQASLAKGADLTATDRFGKTAVDVAVDRGHFDLAHFLLAHRRLLEDRKEKPKSSPPPPPVETALPIAPPAESAPPAPPAPVRKAPSVSAPAAPIAATAAPGPSPVRAANPFEPAQPIIAASETTPPTEIPPPVPVRQSLSVTEPPPVSSEPRMEPPSQIPPPSATTAPERPPGILDRLKNLFSPTRNTEPATEAAVSENDPAPPVKAAETTEPAEPEEGATPEPPPSPPPAAVPPPRPTPPRPAPVAGWMKDTERPFDPGQPLPPAGRPDPAPTPAPSPPHSEPVPIQAAIAETKPVATEAPESAEPQDRDPPVRQALAEPETAANDPSQAERKRSLFDRISDFLGSETDAPSAPARTSEAVPGSPPPSIAAPEPAVAPEPIVAPGPEASPEIAVERKRGFLDRMVDALSWNRDGDDGVSREVETAEAEASSAAPAATIAEPRMRPTPAASWLAGSQAHFEPDKEIGGTDLPHPDTVPVPDKRQPDQIVERETAASAGSEAADETSMPAPESPTQPPLTGVTLTFGEGLALGSPRADAGPDADNCIKKRSWIGTYCVVEIHWPKAVNELFTVRTHLYAGAKAVVRFDDGAATRFHSQFIADAFESVMAFFTAQLGPPTTHPAYRRIWIGTARTENPVARWEVANAEGRITQVLEIRKFDDVSGMFPDSQFGSIRLYAPSTPSIFQELSTVDLALLHIARTRPSAPGNGR